MLDSNSSTSISYTTPPFSISSPGSRIDVSTSYSISGNTSYPYYIVSFGTPQFLSLLMPLRFNQPITVETISTTLETLQTIITTGSTLVTIYTTETLVDTVDVAATSITTVFTAEPVTTVTITESPVYPSGTGSPYYSILPPAAASSDVLAVVAAVPAVPVVPRVRRVVNDVEDDLEDGEEFDDYYEQDE